jgi:polysaccharide pyruvyl transferase WcaK-like protein
MIDQGRGCGVLTPPPRGALFSAMPDQVRTNRGADTSMTTDRELTGRPRVVLIHAYSRANSGDGLLVDESAELVREAFPGARIDLVALAPDTFPEFPDALHPLYGRRGASAKALARAAAGRLHPTVQDETARADLVIAVGGGYLRADTVRGFVKTSLAHLPQLPSSPSSPPFIYLPQSIGPFPGSGRMLRDLRNARHVYVRDDLSRSLLREHGVLAERMPDLALLSRELGDGSPATGQGFGLIARQLGRRSSRYDAAILALRDALDARPLVQSSGRGNDDPAYYQRLGLGTGHSAVADVLSGADRPSVVVSVRLHGSLQSLHRGTPTIHLSYERKGWGAFEDLGLGAYVHSARHFDVDAVAEQARALAEDPSDYWAAVEEAKVHLRDARARLVASLQEMARDS